MSTDAEIIVHWGKDGLVDAEVVPVPFKDPKKQIPLAKASS